MKEKNSYLKLNANILAAGTVVGKMEREGPLGDCFDFHDPDNSFGMKTWEEAESEMQRMALNSALAKNGRSVEKVEALFAGDLLNQCVGSAYGLLSFDVPYFGLYGACSTSVEGLLLASMAVTGGFANCAAAVTSSHYCSAERQYRTPLEYGSQRPPTAQWTVTGSGAFLVGKENGMAKVTGGMAGIVRDAGLSDVNNMGAAMAPAAVDTFLRYFAETGRKPSEFDAIVTGDLGFEGGSILVDLMQAKGYSVKEIYADCGQLIFDRFGQDVHGGGSGCGCAAAVLGGYFLPQLQAGKLGKILFTATGAMMSPDSIKQGKNIPSIAHLLELESPKKG